MRNFPTQSSSDAEKRKTDTWQSREKTKNRKQAASVLVGTFCILFLATGLGFFGYGIYCFINGEYDVTKRLIMVIVGAVVTIATVFVWRMFHRNLHNDE